MSIEFCLSQGFHVFRGRLTACWCSRVWGTQSSLTCLSFYLSCAWLGVISFEGFRISFLRIVDSEFSSCGHRRSWPQVLRTSNFTVICLANLHQRRRNRDCEVDFLPAALFSLSLSISLVLLFRSLRVSFFCSRFFVRSID